MAQPPITLARQSGTAALMKRIAGLTKLAAYVGVPSQGVERSRQLLDMAGTTKSKKRQVKLNKAAQSDVSNAELLFIHTMGSPARNIPARPVLQPAVEATGNKEIIARELAASTKASLDGDHDLAVKKMRRAALAGQTAARKWFTDSRNSWAENKPTTIAAKGSDKPLIDTGALRASIVGVIKEE